MRSLKTFQGFLCLLYQFLLILEVKCGTKRELFDCGTVHICDCGLWDEYLKCWNLAPPQVKEIFQAVFTEFFPGEYDLYQDMNPLKIRFCNKTTIENVYEFYVKMDSDLRTYVKEIHSNPFRSKEQLQSHNGRACVTPLIGKCVEFGDKCG